MFKNMHLKIDSLWACWFIFFIVFGALHLMHVDKIVLSSVFFS
jgi:hypothetical protein